jgi:chromosome segregation ATPase
VKLKELQETIEQQRLEINELGRVLRRSREQGQEAALVSQELALAQRKLAAENRRLLEGKAVIEREKTAVESRLRKQAKKTERITAQLEVLRAKASFENPQKIDAAMAQLANESHAIQEVSKRLSDALARSQSHTKALAVEKAELEGRLDSALCELRAIREERDAQKQRVDDLGAGRGVAAEMWLQNEFSELRRKLEAQHERLAALFVAILGPEYGIESFSEGIWEQTLRQIREDLRKLRAFQSQAMA